MEPFEPFDSVPPGGDGHRGDRLLVWASTAGALACSLLIFLVTNVSEPDPVAEPVPSPTTAQPLAQSTTITTTIATTTTTTTTTVQTTTQAPPPVTTTTTTRRTTTTLRTTPPPQTTVQTTTTTPTRRCVVSTWQWDTAYDGGAMVSWNGSLWVAKWWNYNAIPGANQEGVWDRARSC
ncbi:hypothetical protein [Kutzneria buriramensis]|uniref:Carbohydrate binding protein n=1 Tax=Kutzneria buriramensis TaxID=1045776 RepID=A0A3E0HFH7_9PSEU|nr:hypothetical protein [Kutzneria buriramensis]REH43816.1 carbohydrate binding protein [Kutzneria buriramensis]